MIAVTGATGQLGRLVIDSLLRLQPGVSIIAAARDPAKAADLKARGVEVRQADYDKPETLAAAFKGVDKLLLISANEVGRRLPQHATAIEAATKAGVKFVAYTSILNGERSSLRLAEEHVATERLLAQSGIPYALLRNGWYTENETASLVGVLAHGAFIGASGEGRYSWASREDYAEAAARVMLAEDQAGRIYELAGDAGMTMGELAAETSKLAGKPIVYANLPESDYAGALRGFGLPAPVADIFADGSAKAAGGALFNDSHTLSKLIGRPTTPVSETLAAALKAAATQP